jgi:hypothetical protein
MHSVQTEATVVLSPPPLSTAHFSAINSAGWTHAKPTRPRQWGPGLHVGGCAGALPDETCTRREYGGALVSVRRGEGRQPPAFPAVQSQALLTST